MSTATLAQLLINGTVGLCVASVLVAVLMNFLSAQEDAKVKKEKRSIVATFTMILFFIIMYFCLRFQWGTLNAANLSRPLQITLITIGLILMILGAITNIYGRIALATNWGDHVRIYTNHTVVKKGPYKFVRHPLYASLIWMFFAAAIIYTNWIVALANALIFIPAMHYRAKQEETALCKQFKEYTTYQKEVGMLFPKLFR